MSGALLFGGHRLTEIPESRSQINSHTVLAWLGADATWIESAASHEQRAAFEGRDPRHHPDTGWLSDPEYLARQQKKRDEILAKKRDPRPRWED